MQRAASLPGFAQPRAAGGAGRAPGTRSIPGGGGGTENPPLPWSAFPTYFATGSAAARDGAVEPRGAERGTGRDQVAAGRGRLRPHGRHKAGGAPGAVERSIPAPRCGNLRGYDDYFIIHLKYFKQGGYLNDNRGVVLELFC